MTKSEGARLQLVEGEVTKELESEDDTEEQRIRNQLELEDEAWMRNKIKKRIPTWKNIAVGSKKSKKQGEGDLENQGPRKKRRKYALLKNWGEAKTTVEEDPECPHLGKDTKMCEVEVTPGRQMLAATPVEEHRRLEEDHPAPGRRGITPTPADPLCGDAETTPGYNRVAASMTVCQPLATENCRDNPGFDHVTEISAFVETADVILQHLEVTHKYDKELMAVTDDKEKDTSTGVDMKDECHVAPQLASSDNSKKRVLENNVKKTSPASMDGNIGSMMSDQRSCAG